MCIVHLYSWNVNRPFFNVLSPSYPVTISTELNQIRENPFILPLASPLLRWKVKLKRMFICISLLSFPRRDSWSPAPLVRWGTVVQKSYMTCPRSLGGQWWSPHLNRFFFIGWASVTHTVWFLIFCINDLPYWGGMNEINLYPVWTNCLNYITDGPTVYPCNLATL